MPMFEECLRPMSLLFVSISMGGCELVEGEPDDDDRAPVVTWIAPMPGAVVDSEGVTLWAQVSDPDGLSGVVVRFWSDRDGALTGDLSTVDGTVSAKVDLSLGDHRLRVTAEDPELDTSDAELDVEVVCGERYGLDSECPARSCLDALLANPTLDDGRYFIDPDQGGVFEVYCDMRTDGGGAGRSWAS